MEDYEKYYQNCRLCPRECGADRLHGESGFCRVTSVLRAARAALHFWEEPCISGRRGSGAVFFSGCNVGCVYCQNHQIADGSSGKDISTDRLTQMFFELKEKGAENINMVTPDHYAPAIAHALKKARGQGLDLPVIYNGSAYIYPRTLDLLKPYVDVWLPDLKYMDADIAGLYSHAADYFPIASRAIDYMVKAAGPAQFDSRGMIRRGVIVRHLVLPCCRKDAQNVIRYLYETYGDDIYISIMGQYTPLPGQLDNFPQLNRRITSREYDACLDYALDLGVVNAYIQERGTAKESFIPAFDNEGV